MRSLCCRCALPGFRQPTRRTNPNWGAGARVDIHFGGATASLGRQPSCEGVDCVDQALNREGLSEDGVDPGHFVAHAGAGEYLRARTGGEAAQHSETVLRAEPDIEHEQIGRSAEGQSHSFVHGRGRGHDVPGVTEYTRDEVSV
jgi:hypothetical protein